MSFRVKTITVFDRQAKRLSKKFPSLKRELPILINKLALEPTQGTSIGHNSSKIRLAIASKGKGKSGGARVITHVLFKNETAYLLSIYDKGEESLIIANDFQEEKDSVKVYDAAKAEEGEIIPFDQAVNEIEAQRSDL